MVEHLPSKQYVVGLIRTKAAPFSFSMEKELFRLIVFPCLFNRSKIFHVYNKKFIQYKNGMKALKYTPSA